MGLQKFPKKLKKKIDKTVDVLNLGLTDVKTYRKRKDPKQLQKSYKRTKRCCISHTPDGYFIRLVN